MLTEKEFKLNKPGQKLDQLTFVTKANKIHDYKFSYSTYTSAHNHIDIWCPIHGRFSQLAYSHLQGRCKKCSNNISKEEKEVLQYITNLKEDLILCPNDRTVLKPKELDIYIPEFNFAIEYNGLYYHSTNKKDSRYIHMHVNKTNLCVEKNIHLFHIFSNEWKDTQKREIWCSMIKNKLKLNQKIGARETEIGIPTAKEASIFETNNHLQGTASSSVRLGLYYNTTLVSLMTFSKGRATISSDAEWELVRFCSQKDYNVIGAASKLLKYFELNYKPKSLKSFANRRWSKGDLYNKLGFKLTHISPPNYFYFKENEHILYTRNKFQKHKLKGFLTYFDDTQTADENIFYNKYRKIYDSGNYVFIKKY